MAFNHKTPKNNVVQKKNNIQPLSLSVWSDIRQLYTSFIGVSMLLFTYD